MNDDVEQVVATAQRLADDVLFPNALDADRAGSVPEMQLDALADAGLYGLSTWADPGTVHRAVETLAGGCLTTTFVWVQHLGTASAAAASTGPVRRELAGDLATGALRGGVAFAHMLRSGPPMTTAEPVEGGWVLRGSAPWVTGWGHVDIVRAASRHEDRLVWSMIDGVESDTLVAHPLDMAAMNSTQTVVLEFRDHFVPEHRIDAIENYDDWRSRYALGLRANGSLALGVAARCCRLLGDEIRVARLNAIRRELDTSEPADNAVMSAARAEASRFAVDCATALVAQVGGTAVMMDNHAQRLMREAMFVLVQGQTPAIKQALLDAPRPPHL